MLSQVLEYANFPKFGSCDQRVWSQTKSAEQDQKSTVMELSNFEHLNEHGKSTVDAWPIVFPSMASLTTLRRHGVAPVLTYVTMNYIHPTTFGKDVSCIVLCLCIWVVRTLAKKLTKHRTMLLTYARQSFLHVNEFPHSLWQTLQNWMFDLSIGSMF